MKNGNTGTRFVIAEGNLEQRFQFTLKDLENDPNRTTVTAEVADAIDLMKFISSIPLEGAV